MNARSLVFALLAAPTIHFVSRAEDLVVRAQTIHTMAGDPISDGVIVIRAGKIAAVGPASEIDIPPDATVHEATVVTPGLIDARSTVGFSGILNQPHDQDQLEHSTAIQPELRAIDAYNAHDDLIAWLRAFGVTTIHTGHAPGELISGQTLIIKTTGNTVDENLLVDARAIAVTLATSALKSGAKSPGTRGKMMAMLRAELQKAREYQQKLQRHAQQSAPVEAQESHDQLAADQPDSDEETSSDDDSTAEETTEKDEASKGVDSLPPARDLRLETLVRALDGELPLLITADRVQDIANALRLADEFGVSIWLDSAAESYLLLDEIKAAGVPVLLHPTMARTMGERENLSMETAARLRAAGIPFAIQSGYEAYVPKTRVVLFEAALAAAHGLTPTQALASVTIDTARILGIDERVGSIEPGKDADLALYDGDPLEYTTHAIGTIIDGRLVSQGEAHAYDSHR